MKKNNVKNNNNSKKNGKTKSSNNRSKNIDKIEIDAENKKTFKKKILKFILFLTIIFVIFSSIYIAFYINNFNQMAIDMIKNEFSEVIDKDGKVISHLGSGKITSNIDSNSIPDNLKNAYISIEDQRYYTHHGIDIKRTCGAIWTYIKGFGKSSFGGSTITQQLVKNLTGDDSKNIGRKIKEWILAFSLETQMDKDEILRTYLNNIYVGPNIYGVENASKYYFNKSLENLTLAECAYVAGINNSPNSYSPFSETDNSAKIVKRTKVVLGKMLELKYITESDYNQAISDVDNGLKFKKGNLSAKGSNIYSYHTDALLNEIIEDISKRKHVSSDFARNYLYMAGLKIYSTQDSSIQSSIELEMKNNKYLIYSKNDKSTTAQSAMVIIDQYTGNVLGCVGGLGEKNTSRPLNRVTQMTRQTGSAIKPIAVLAPAISQKIITNSTVFADVATTFDDGTEQGYSPIDYDNYRGSITLRQAVESSQNIPFVSIMQQLTPETSIKYLKKMGITTLTENDNSLPLALGGLDKGMTPLEFAAAYATIANNGVYIEPTFYKKIEKKSGEIFIKSKQTNRKAFSESESFILKELLTQPVKGSLGTATYCAISGMDVAAKTGTTNDNYDRWLCGFTPYYTAVTWYGFDMNESIDYNGKNPAGIIWSDVMKKIHKNLNKKTFTMPSGVIKTTICTKSGKLATNKCHDTYTEYYLEGTLPTKCTEH